jgi:hypothetical protein
MEEIFDAWEPRSQAMAINFSPLVVGIAAILPGTFLTFRFRLGIALTS